MLSQGASLILDSISGLFIVALLLRFYLQLFRAPYGNPLSPFLIALTDFIVRPTRRVIPGLWGLDLATLILAFLVKAISISISLWVSGIAPHPFGSSTYLAILLLSVTGLMKQSVHIFMVVIIVQAILSWVNPYAPIAPVLNSLSRPFLDFFRKRIPPVGNVDLSPIIVIFLMQLVLTIPVAWLESLSFGML